MHAWWAEPDSLSHARAELQRALPGAVIDQPEAGFLSIADIATPPVIAFARQALPNARRMPVPSIRAAGEAIANEVLGSLPDEAPWRLHVASCYGMGRAGENRCRLIDEAVVEILRRRRRMRMKSRLPGDAPPRAGECWVQWLLVAPDRAVASVAGPDLVRSWLPMLVPAPAGQIPVASDKSAPCRAFAKLAEAEVRMGQRIVPGQSVVDLGASPGSWTHWAVQQGATVTSVDRAPLREDLMSHPRVRFAQGDAFAHEPARAVDWLVCDVIAAPRRSIDLAIRWARNRWARRLVVTIKFKGNADYPILDELKSGLAPLCAEFRLARLCANRNEACVMAVLPEFPPCP